MAYTNLQVVFDAADPWKLGPFWALALGYVQDPVPEGFATIEDFFRSIGLKEEEFGNQYALVDPAGEGPRIFIQRVPEPKTTKNRVHLDVRVAKMNVWGDERERLIEERVARLTEAGGTEAWRIKNGRSTCVVMRDPEGNELCVC